jgi:hypothetical protein
MTGDRGPVAVGAVLLVLAGALPAAAQQRPADRPFTFAVAGHIRGEADGALNPKVRELVQRMRDARVDLVVLTGDAIWGDYRSVPARPQQLDLEWGRVDSAFAPLGVPVWRVPGNHDLFDYQSRAVYERRYGLPPAVKTFGDSRFILLHSILMPADTPAVRDPRPVDLDSAQVAFLRRTLADTGYAHTFVFVHHVLWWEPEGGRWWREVHPLLVAARVDAVFSGDYGPMKFSALERDGVRYYRGAMEMPTSAQRLRWIPASRALSAQFDTWFVVRVDGDSVAIEVRPVAEVSSGEFTRERWLAIENAPPFGWRTRWGLFWRDRKRLLFGVVLLAGLSFAAGVVLGRRLRPRRGAAGA